MITLPFWKHRLCGTTQSLNGPKMQMLEFLTNLAKSVASCWPRFLNSCSRTVNCNPIRRCNRSSHPMWSSRRSTIVGISKMGGPRSSIRWGIPCGLPTQFWWRLIRSAHRKSVTLVSCVFGACIGGAKNGLRLVCMGHARVTHATHARCFARDLAGKK